MSASKASIGGVPHFELPASPQHPSLLHYACAVLNTSHHLEKARLTSEAAQLYRKKLLPIYPTPAVTNADLPVPPSKPARPEHLKVLAPKDMPRAEKGVGNHDANKIRLIHSLAHIESYAIDLSWDILVRFATAPGAKGRVETEGVEMPDEFYADWLRIADEEAKHFSIWNHRLEELGSSYGALPVHEGLWESAGQTAHSLLARLAVVHAVHEARGLDATPRMLQQLTTYGDKHSYNLLEIIEMDELTHVRSGLDWFKYLCKNATAGPIDDPIKKFHEIVRANFRGSLLPPFNTKARAQCGFTEEWYLPLAVKKEKPAAVAPVAAESEASASAPVASADKVQEEKAQVAQAAQ